MENEKFRIMAANFVSCLFNIFFNQNHFKMKRQVENRLVKFYDSRIHFQDFDIFPKSA